MKKIIPALLFSLIFTTVAALRIPAQEKTIVTPAPTGFTLEVTYYKGRPNAFMAFTGNLDKVASSWFALFRRVEGFKQPAGAQPVRAVNIVSLLENNVAKVQISVYVGEGVNDKEEFVANYILRENEKISVAELTKVGVGPFDIALVRTAPTTADLPAVVNKTTSLQVSLEALYETLPSCKATFQNNSSKAIRAFSWELVADGVKQQTGAPQKKDSTLILEPGKTFQLRIPCGKSVRTSEADTKTRPNLVFQINAVVFADGTYEGNSAEAGSLNAVTLAKKIQLQAIIPMFSRALEGDAGINALDKLIADVSALKKESDEEVFQNFIKDYPALSDKEKNNIRSSAMISANIIKLDLRNELQAFRDKAQTSDTDAIRAFLTDKKAQLQAWLARVS